MLVLVIALVGIWIPRSVVCWGVSRGEGVESRYLGRISRPVELLSLHRQWLSKCRELVHAMVC